MDAHFGNTLTYGGAVAKIAHLGPVNPGLNPHPARSVRQIRKPVIKQSGGKDAFH